MTRIPGPTLAQLDALGDDYAGLLARTLAEVARDAVILPEFPTPEDLAALRRRWDDEVDETLLPALGVGFEVGAAQVRVGLREAVGLTAAAWTDVPATQDALAEAYLASARNRLVGVGDELWEHAREELLEGMRLGEGIDELAARIVGVPGMTEARAGVVARTECFPGDTAVQSDGIRAVYRRWYEGPVLRVHMASGNQFTGTPNHPVLTPGGWVALSDLAPGDELVCHGGGQGVRAAGDVDVGDVPAPLSQIYDALSTVGVVLRAKTGQPDFHGDGVDGHVDVATTDRELADRFVALGGQLLEDLVLQGSLPRAVALGRQRELVTVGGHSDSAHDPERSQPTLNRVDADAVVAGQVGGTSARSVLGGELVDVQAEPSPAVATGQPMLRPLGLPQRPERDSGLDEYGFERSRVDVEALLQSTEALSRPVGVDQVITVEVMGFHGHVYNLSTERGWFDVSGYYSANCNGAANAGAMAQVRAAGVTGSKEWIATEDERVRPTHHLADFAKVRLDEHFTVGGFPMDRPHDPAGPPQETVNCRCTLGFDLDLEDVEPVTDGGNGGSGGGDDGRDRSFLAGVFAKGLAFMARLFKGRETLQADITGGDEMTAAATETVEATSSVSSEGAWEGVLVVEGSPTGDGRQFSQGALTWAPLPLSLKWQEREGPGHDGAVVVGRIDEIRREGNQVIGRGVFDLDGVHGREAHRLIAGRYLRGISIQPDDIGNSDVEYVYADQSSVVDETGEDDGGQALAQILGKPDLEIYHAARIRSATLAPEAAFVEAEIRLTNAPMEDRTMVAAATLDDYRPPAEFFTRCTDPIPTVTTPDGRVFRPALGVSDDRRVWGYAAQWEECHIGFPGVCTSPPQEDDFAHYMLGEVLCAGGERVPVGQITMHTGHASTAPQVSARAAAEHYDHTGAVVADVVVGADDYGIWLSGAVRPGADLTAFRAAGAVSGDWRRINGALRLVALLTVNVPGFQQVRARVASGVQTALVAAGQVGWKEVTEPDLRPVAERIAGLIGRDRASRLAAARERVHANAGR